MGTVRHRRRGQALTEFALILPLMAVMTLGVIDMARVVWAMDITASAAREATRYAIVHGGSPGTACPMGPDSGQSTIPFPSAACPHPSPSTQSIKDVALSRSTGAGANVTAFVCYGTDCEGDTHAPGASNARGSPVTVRVEADLPLFTAALLGMDGFTIDSTSTMLISN